MCVGRVCQVFKLFSCSADPAACRARFRQGWSRPPALKRPEGAGGCLAGLQSCRLARRRGCAARKRSAHRRSGGGSCPGCSGPLRRPAEHAWPGPARRCSANPEAAWLLGAGGALRSARCIMQGRRAGVHLPQVWPGPLSLSEAGSPGAASSCWQPRILRSRRGSLRFPPRTCRAAPQAGARCRAASRAARRMPGGNLDVHRLGGRARVRAQGVDVLFGGLQVPRTAQPQADLGCRARAAAASLRQGRRWACFVSICASAFRWDS